MSPAELVANLADRGAALALDGDGRVRYHGLREVLTEDLREALRAHLAILPEVLRRAEVFQALVRPGQPLPLLCLPGARGLTTGCPSCGGDLADRSYRCGPCGEAARVVAGAPPWVGGSPRCARGAHGSRLTDPAAETQPPPGAQNPGQNGQKSVPAPFLPKSRFLGVDRKRSEVTI